MSDRRRFRPDDDVGYRHEIIPPDEPDCPYLDRRVLGVGIPGRKSLFSVRLHHFYRSDEDHLHDHPTWFITLVLRGSYDDVVACPGCGEGIDQDVRRLFETWKRATGRTRRRLTSDDYHLAESFVERYGFETVERAIAGIAFDHHAIPRKNGPDRPMTDWRDLFRSADRFEYCANVAPHDFVPAVCGTCGGTGQVVGERMTPGKVRYRPALHRHRVVTDGCWTLCLFGRKQRDWGFVTPDGWLRQRAYFRRYGGHSACDEVDA